MSPFIRKYFPCLLLAAAMIVLLLVNIFRIVALQRERDMAGAGVRNMERSIAVHTKRVKEAEMQRDNMCSATNLWRRYATKSEFRDISDSQVIRVRVLRVPYGRTPSVAETPRSRAIGLASLSSPYSSRSYNSERQ